MGDWDFLYDMHERGYPAEEIAHARACGYAPWESIHLEAEWVDSELDDVDVVDVRLPGSGTPFKSREGFPRSFRQQAEILQDLIDSAIRHFENTGRYLQIWGELGEIYAEVAHGLRRHGTHHAGSDGTIDGVRVEVKTISPEKRYRTVTVSSQGDFEKLMIVRIDRDFSFKAKLFDRSELKSAGVKYMNATF